MPATSAIVTMGEEATNETQKNKAKKSIVCTDLPPMPHNRKVWIMLQA